MTHSHMPFICVISPFKAEFRPCLVYLHSSRLWSLALSLAQNVTRESTFFFSQRAENCLILVKHSPKAVTIKQKAKDRLDSPRTLWQYQFVHMCGE